MCSTHTYVLHCLLKTGCGLLLGINLRCVLSVLLCGVVCAAYIALQDADVVGADFLGQAIIPVSEVIKGQLFDQWLELTDQTGAPVQSKDIAGCVAGVGSITGAWWHNPQ